MIDKSLFALPGVRMALLVLVLTDVVRAFAVVGQAWALASAIVALWEGGALIDQLGWILLFFCCFVSRQLLSCIQDAYLENYAAARAEELRQALLKTVFSGGAAVVQEHGTGAVSAMVIEGVDQVETYIRLILPKTVGVVVIPLILLCWIFPQDWVSGVIALVAFPCIILYMVILGHTAQDEAAKRHASFELMSNHFIDSLRGIDTLKLFGRSKEHGDEVYEVSEQFREATVKTLRVATLSSTVLDLFSTGALAAVSIMLGFRLLDGSLALFPALFVLILVPEYFKPVHEFASDYHASLDGKNALSGIQELIAAGEVRAAGMKADAGAAEGGNIASAAGASAGARLGEGAPEDEECPGRPDKAAIAPWGADSTLELRGVDFAYPDYQALTQVGFSARGFEKLGIVGESGAGKSTLVNLLGGFAAPTAGEVLVDGRAEGDLRQAAWQAQVIYIPQSPYVFHATLRENIAFYCPDADEERIQSAVRTVGLEELVEELPEGLDTLIGEGARALSGGQAQRIALARAFLDDSRRILLFDEPTAHLDIETELELKERMLPLMEGRLVFFATHRLHWMGQMDRILVLEGGRIVESGTLEELQESGGAFCRLVSQTGGEGR